MSVEIFHLGPLETNCFLLHAQGRAVVIDPGGDPKPVLSFLQSNNLALTHILNTHLHCDHIYGNKVLQEKTGAPVLCSPDDVFLLETEIGGGGFMGLPRVDTFKFEHLEESRTEFLNESCQVLKTPGHSPGSLSLYFPDSKMVFVGDLLFTRSIGRTDFHGGDMDVLLESVRKKIFSLPAETVVYSGHGPSTTVGDEKNHNPFFQ
ncbi:MAG: MBL fold metallo-hydrolase [Desulfovibrionales bacterium]